MGNRQQIEESNVNQEQKDCIVNYIDHVKIPLINNPKKLKDGRFIGTDNIKNSIYILKKDDFEVDIKIKFPEILDIYETKIGHLVICSKESLKIGKISFIKLTSQKTYEIIHEINIYFKGSKYVYSEEYEKSLNKINYAESLNKTNIFGYTHVSSKVQYLEIYIILFYEYHNNTYQLIRKIKYKLKESDKPDIYVLRNEQVILRQKKILSFFHFYKCNLMYEYREEDEKDEILKILEYTNNYILINSYYKTILYDWKKRNKMMNISHNNLLVPYISFKGMIFAQRTKFKGQKGHESIKIFNITNEGFKVIQDLSLTLINVDIKIYDNILYIFDLDGNNPYLYRYKIII